LTGFSCADEVQAHPLQLPGICGPAGGIGDILIL
jgi:hypothetical protein